jgi:hypothetical protein
MTPSPGAPSSVKHVEAAGWDSHQLYAWPAFSTSHRLVRLDRGSPAAMRRRWVASVSSPSRPPWTSWPPSAACRDLDEQPIE